MKNKHPGKGETKRLRRLAAAPALEPRVVARFIDSGARERLRHATRSK